VISNLLQSNPDSRNY